MRVYLSLTLFFFFLSYIGANWQLSQRVKITKVKPLLHDDQSATYRKYMVTVKVQKSESFHYIHVSVGNYITEVKPLLHDDQSATYSKYMVTVKVQKSESFHYIHVSVGNYRKESK